MSPKTSTLEPLRVRIRRFQFIVGLGFIALVAGSALSVSLTLRLSLRVQSLPFGPLKVLVAVLLENLWVLVVLPVLCYGAARVMELKPWNTAVGAAVSGATFVLALGFVQGGVDALWLGGLGSVLNVAAFGVGTIISARALMLGRAAAAQQSEKTQAKAEERKSEYDEFLRAAEQGGARLEQRESQGTPAPVTDVTVVVPPTSVSTEARVATATRDAPASESVAEEAARPASVAVEAPPASEASSPPASEEGTGQVVSLPARASEEPPTSSDTSKTPAA